MNHIISIFLLILVIGISLLILPLFAIMPHQTKAKTKDDVKVIKDISSIANCGMALVIIGAIGCIAMLVCYAIFGIERFDGLFYQYLEPIIFGIISLVALVFLIINEIKRKKDNKKNKTASMEVIEKGENNSEQS